MQIFAVLFQNMSYEGDDQRIHHQLPVCKRSMEGFGRVLIIHNEIRTDLDPHLLPHVQAFHDSLGRNSWFSLFDQGKAYHQCYMTLHCKDSFILQEQY